MSRKGVRKMDSRLLRFHASVTVVVVGKACAGWCRSGIGIGICISWVTIYRERGNDGCGWG